MQLFDLVENSEVDYVLETYGMTLGDDAKTLRPYRNTLSATSVVKPV